MSGIDDLKQNNSPVQVQVGENNQRHTIVEPKRQTISSPMSTRARQEVKLSDLPKPKDEEIPGVDIRKSMASDILEGDKSPFGKYLKEKRAEAANYMAQKDLDKEIDDEMEEDVDKDTTNAPDIYFEPTFNFDEDESSDEITEQDVDKTVSIDTEDMSDFDKENTESYEEYNEKESDSEEESFNEEDDFNLTESTAVDTKIEIVEESEDESEEAVEDPDEEETLKRLQRLVSEKIKPVSQSLNISSFTIAKKASSTQLKALENQKVKAAKWVLPAQESIVLMKEFLGSELENLREYSEDPSNVSMLFTKYRSIYDHIVSPKPATYEAWLKSTPFADLQHYFFAVYVASFKGSNYLPMDCKNPKCDEAFITDNVEILNMVKFGNEEARKKFKRLYQSEQQLASKGIYVSEIIPLSRKIAIGFKDATIYGLLEMTMLDRDFVRKYNTIIDFIPYIDTLYLINEENQTLEPIEYKVYPENVNKTIKSKVVTYAKILKTLSVDEFGPIKSYIQAITSKRDAISYMYPATTCPKCGKSIDEIPASAEELVFTRYQLGALASTSLN